MTRTWLLASLCGLSVVLAPLSISLAFDPPATSATSKPAIYDESADAKQQIAAALAHAKKENRRVLIQWGGNWCPWCVRLHKLYTSDKNIAKALLYEYDIVYVDSGKPAGKNVELAKSYGATVDKDGFPFLTILDADGKVLVNQETEALEVKDDSGKSKGLEAGHDPALVLKLLDDHKATYLKAQDVFDKGLAEARSSGKLAFVHFGAPWCGWCHKLENWMSQPEIAPILAKQFVDVKIDTERTVGGQALLDKHSNGKSGGIPWFAFFDGDGKQVADSNNAKGNIGFPAAPDEIEHFGMMLKKGGKLSDDDTRKLVDSLKAAAKPVATSGGS